ncbi:CASP-like protein 4B1 [Andrographis paniculata]|uniref:CASP-like protein 4B1 n=1 Tax=Andrographis paniculata TaxID=175694 RepID=UPI0021E78EBB|nr:CASP-like protein 4B1 [Andrographis paniculata]
MTNPTDTPQSPPPPGGTGISGIARRWNRDDLVKKGSLPLRGFGFVFSLLSFIIMASNKHGDWKDFDKYEEYRYVLATAILSTLYTGLQSLRDIHQRYTGTEILSRHKLATLDFIGDQILAYLLISAASSAVPLTNKMREGADNIFTDASASAISLEFLAFLSLALSALASGYKLTNQLYT